MAKVYLINTNKNNNPDCEGDMLDSQKCSSYYTPDIKWNQTMILLADHFSRKVWQHITRNCINY
ncbi:hypothetical protein [Bacillus sp. MRMR6]|uniref:hypothetical protein n=1 Tax=Bacillus sp. MRMR6 TaxID=1928617 RepID=UPI0009526D1E|nr:hypothetical protein [Bacillus sp. MRMR6]OLS33739.1 hypothetical protein BTR25_24225 [Bacillus sp. MRMR6]